MSTVIQRVLTVTTLMSCLASTHSARASDAPFAVDINLVDMAYHYYFNDLPAEPVLALLDRNGDYYFDIFDLDLIVNEYQNPPEPMSCEGAGDNLCTYPSSCLSVDSKWICADCIEDQDCWFDGVDGSHCSNYRCVRSCGPFNEGQSFRDCYGQDTRCDVTRGRCYQVENPEISCQIDADCLMGSYCDLGACRHYCYRQQDCGQEPWACEAATNKCVMREEDDGSVMLDPTHYQVAFGTPFLRLERNQNRLDLPVAIIDKRTKKEVVAADDLRIPYRLRTVFYPRVSADCVAFADETEEEKLQRQERCQVTPFLSMEKPTGILRAERGQFFRLNVVAEQFANLPSGTYNVEVKLIAGNGNTSSMSLSYENPSASGKYEGVVVLDEPAALGQLFVSMDIKITQDTVVWKDLLSSQYAGYGFIQLGTGLTIEDESQGRLVYGSIDPQISIMFPAEENQEDVPFVGLYQPESNQLRILFEIEEPKNQDEPASDDMNLQHENLFGKNMRRLVYLVGSLDSIQRVFSGLYRETLYGIADAPYTLGGVFSLSQMQSESGTIEPPTDLLVGHGEYVANEDDFSFSFECPDVSNTLEEAGLLVGNVFSVEKLKEYLSQRDEKEKEIFGETFSFKTRIKDALEQLGAEGKAADEFRGYLKEQAGLCSADSEPGDTCIDESKLRCLLHFYAQAVLSDAIPSLDTMIPEDEPELANLRYSLTTRFVQVLAELLMLHNFSAGDEIAEAYRVFLSTQAPNAFKTELQHVVSGFGHHVESRKILFHPQIQKALRSISSTMYHIPINGHTEYVSELGLGGVRSVIDKPVSQLKNSLNVLAKYLNQKRRETGTSDPKEIVFLRKLGQQLYLEAMTLVALQESWMGPAIQYTDQSFVADIVRLVLDINQKQQESKNPLGLDPEEVFFESHGQIPPNCSNSHQDNESNYRYYVAEYNCHRARALALRTEVINEFSALKITKEKFEQDLFETQEKYAAELDLLCGDETSYVNCPEGQDSDTGVIEEIEYECADDYCQSLSSRFVNYPNFLCRPDLPKYQIFIQNEDGVANRKCYNGQVGTLLRKIEEIRNEQSMVRMRLDTMRTQIEMEKDNLTAMIQENEELVEYYNEKTLEFQENSAALYLINRTEQLAVDQAEGLPKSNGFSNDLTAPARMGIMVVAHTIAHDARNIINMENEAMRRAEQLKMMEHSQNAAVRETEKKISSMLVEGYNIAAQTLMLERQIMGIKVEIDQILNRAERTLANSLEANKNLIDYLVGDQQNHRFQRNYLVMRAEEHYQRALLATYKLGKAFEYDYNYPQEGIIANRVFRLRTIEDLEDFGDMLTDEQDRLWKGIGKPVEVVHTREFSLRELLFPNLLEKVDSSTGELISPAVQFHHLIFSSKYRKVRPSTHTVGTMVEQIELPFSIWLQELKSPDGLKKYFMMNPDECNALITKVRFKVVGQNLEQDFHFVLKRDGLDDLRTCYLVPDELQGNLQPPTTIINRFRLPSHVQNVTPGIVNTWSQWQELFVDRSVGASDWTLIIPNDGTLSNAAFFEYDGNTQEHLAPVLKDIVIEVEYRSRNVVNALWQN